jgi:hypothetical protein
MVPPWYSSGLSFLDRAREARSLIAALISRAERSAIESLVFTLKEGFEFGQMARRTHENVHAEMLEKVLAYNVSQIIRVKKKLLELQSREAQQAAA